MLSNRAKGYTEARTTLGAAAKRGPGGLTARSVTGLALGSRQCLHNGACNEERDDRDKLADEDGSVHVDRGPPLGLAVLDHPGTGRPCAHAEAGSAVPGRIASSAPTSHDTGGRDDGDPVLLVRLAVHAADGDDVLG